MGPLGHGRRHCHRLGRLSVHLLPHRLRGRRFRARGQRHLDSMAPRSLEPPPHPAHGLPFLVDPARRRLERPSISLETTRWSFEANPKRVESTRRPGGSKPRSIDSKRRPVESKPHPDESIPRQVKSKRESIESMRLPVETKPRPAERMGWRVDSMGLPVGAKRLPVKPMRSSLESLRRRLLSRRQPVLPSMLLPLGLPRPRRAKVRLRRALPRRVFGLTTQLLPRAGPPWDPRPWTHVVLDPHGATTTPHGNPPMCTRWSTWPVAGSTMDRSPDDPFAV